MEEITTGDNRSSHALKPVVTEVLPMLVAGHSCRRGRAELDSDTCSHIAPIKSLCHDMVSAGPAVDWAAITPNILSSAG